MKEGGVKPTGKWQGWALVWAAGTTPTLVKDTAVDVAGEFMSHFPEKPVISPLRSKTLLDPEASCLFYFFFQVNRRKCGK